MITLKAPIELKNRTDFVKDHEGFGERIAGNYALMGLEIGAEELLHLVSSPPEIYLAEGDATTIVGNTIIANRNEEKLDIINNMLNRIMLSVNTELSYQDRAYITDALYKLGIKDDRKFMREVRRIMNESHTEEDFINSYLAVDFDRENTELRRETLELSREVARIGAEERLRERDNYLSRSIMHRLQTGAIYQIVANFNKSLNETRMDLAEQLVSEQENTAKNILVQSFLNEMEREGAEIIYREETAGREEAGEEESGAETLREISGETRTEREKSVLSELQSVVREATETVSEETGERSGTQIIYREEASVPRPGDTEERLTERIRESREYRSANIYEREIRESRIKDTGVTETIGAAVLLDIVKNIYNARFDRITGGDVWTEYRGALYHSSENTLNRVSNVSYESVNAAAPGATDTGVISVNLDYAEFRELSEIQDNETNIDLIENQIREMNEMNLENVSRYEQMTEILKKLQPERRATGGRERTRREALAAIEDQREILESLDAYDGEEESRRREVFHEIARLFPDSAAQVFNVVEQYLSNPATVQGVSVSAGNVAQAAEELMRLQQANERAADQAEHSISEPERGELVFKREERLSEDELTEILDTYRSRETRQRRDINDAREVVESSRTNTTTVILESERTLSERELEDIEDMVNRGVRSQMGAISEQVLTKLEKRLRNEKSRRGI